MDVLGRKEEYVIEGREMWERIEKLRVEDRVGIRPLSGGDLD